MYHFQFISKSENDTKNFAKDLAKFLEKKDVIVLTGDLGSGKTKFTEGLLCYFGLDNEISSPTFTVVNEYKKNNISILFFPSSFIIYFFIYRELKICCLCIEFFLYFFLTPST